MGRQPRGPRTGNVFRLIFALIWVAVTAGQGEVEPEIEGEFIIKFDGVYEVNGIAQASMTMRRGLVYKIQGPGTPPHPLFISDTSAGGTQGSNAYNAKRTQSAGGLCICPNGEAGKYVEVPAVIDGYLLFQPSEETPDRLWYNCYTHDGIGGSIQVLNYENDTGSPWKHEMNGNVCSYCSYTSYRSIIEAHAGCMFSAFGAILPVGAFLAYTGYHKFHVYFQIAGVTIAIAGAACAFVYVDRSNGHHLSNPHHIMGLLILILACLAQPIAVLTKKREAHHKNGAVVIGFGLVNIIFGIFYLGLDVSFIYLYVLYLSFLLVVFVFDPLQLRARRMIEIAQMKARGEDTAVDAIRLLQGKSHENFPSNELKKRSFAWEAELTVQEGKITFVKTLQ